MDTEKKYIAFTFDDGPSNVTEKVLDILEENNIPGTFFLIGNQITPEVKATLAREISLGCEIANHSYTHSDMTKLTAYKIVEEIEQTTMLIEKAGAPAPSFFRPPYILVNDTMFDNIDLPFICGLDSRDWDPSTTAEDRYNNVVNQIKPGNIVLMHDLTNNLKTVEALPKMIKTLKEQGYTFVTVSDLFKNYNINPHVKNKIWSNVLD